MGNRIHKHTTPSHAYAEGVVHLARAGLWRGRAHCWPGGYLGMPDAFPALWKSFILSAATCDGGHGRFEQVPRVSSSGRFARLS